LTTCITLATCCLPVCPLPRCPSSAGPDDDDDGPAPPPLAARAGLRRGTRPTHPALPAPGPGAPTALQPPIMSHTPREWGETRKGSRARDARARSLLSLTLALFFPLSRPHTLTQGGHAARQEATGSTARDVATARIYAPARCRIVPRQRLSFFSLSPCGLPNFCEDFAIIPRGSTDARRRRPFALSLAYCRGRAIPHRPKCGGMRPEMSGFRKKWLATVWKK